MPPLTSYRPAATGMTFTLDTSATRRAYVLSTPGMNAVVTLQGTGVWTVEILTSSDFVNFTAIDTKTLPGQWRYDTRNVAAIAMRVSSYTTGSVMGMLNHGGAVPITNVSSLFSAFLVFNFNATIVEPPTGNQIRFNMFPFTSVTKVWISNTSTDGTDQFFAIRKLPPGATLLVQDRNNHLNAVLFTITGPPIDKTAYVEVPVLCQQTAGVLNSQQVLVAVFNPGAVISLDPPYISVLFPEMEPVVLQGEPVPPPDEPCDPDDHGHHHRRKAQHG